MVVECAFQFKDEYLEGESEPTEFTHSVTVPVGFEVTGGLLFIENPQTHDLQRFSFRIDRNEDGSANFVVLEDVKV